MRRLNAIQEILTQMNLGDTPGFTLEGLKREELIVMNSMILHEVYFANLGASEMSQSFRDALDRDFGSVERWQAEFVAMGKGKGGGSGWVLLTYVQRDSRLVNQWASDHTCSIAGATPILALDMYEHSYHMDYGAKSGLYVDAFMKNINWHNVERMYSVANSNSVR